MIVKKHKEYYKTMEE